MPSVLAGPNTPGRGTWMTAVVAALVLSGCLAAPQGSAAGGPSIIDPSPPVPGSGGQRLLIPAYFYPGASPEPGETVSGEQKWRTMCDALVRRRSIIVLNQNNGKFTEGHAQYKKVLGHCLGRGSTVIGYVHTRQSPTNKYALRPLAAVKRNIDAHFREFGGIRGMFVDEMGNDPALPMCPGCAMTNAEYYQSIYQYIHARSSSALVVGNPGATAMTDWQLADPGTGRPSVDILVNFEGTSSTFVAWSPPSWVTSSPDPNRFAHLVYGSPSAAATTAACRASQQKRAGAVFVTRSTNWELPPDETLLACPTLYRAPQVLAPPW